MHDIALGLIVKTQLINGAMAAPAAQAFDATGTWAGTLDYIGFAGAKEAAKFTSTTKTAQWGPARASASTTPASTRAASSTTRRSHNGEVVFVARGTQGAATDFGSILRAQVTTAANGNASFKATETLQVDGVGFFATCKWTSKRVDRATPSVPDC